MKTILFFIIIIIAACNDNPCEFEAQNANGLNILYYNNTVPQEIFQLEDCSLNGILIEFYPNGVVKKLGYGIEGKKKGVWYLYNQNGELRSKHHFDSGNFVHVSSHNDDIIYNNQIGLLRYSNYQKDLSNDSLLIRSHYSEYFLEKNNDSIILISEWKTMYFDSTLNIIKERIHKKPKI